MQRVEQLEKSAVIAGAERRKGDFIVAGRFAQPLCLPVDGLHTLFAERAIEEACLAEAAAANAPAQHFNDGAVVHDVEKRHNEIFREIHVVHIVADALADSLRHAGVRDIGFHGAVFVVFHIVKRRHVHAFNLRRFH